MGINKSNFSGKEQNLEKKYHDATLGTLMSGERKKRGFTLDVMSAFLNQRGIQLTAKNLLNIENNGHALTLEEAEKICKAFKFSSLERSLFMMKVKILILSEEKRKAEMTLNKAEKDIYILQSMFEQKMQKVAVSEKMKFFKKILKNLETAPTIEKFEEILFFEYNDKQIQELKRNYQYWCNVMTDPSIGSKDKSFTKEHVVSGTINDLKKYINSL